MLFTGLLNYIPSKLIHLQILHAYIQIYLYSHARQVTNIKISSNSLLTAGKLTFIRLEVFVRILFENALEFYDGVLNCHCAVDNHR